MISAPEHAQVLWALCEKLDSATRTGLALRWLDRCVRIHAANVVERAGYAASAERLRAMSELCATDHWLRARSTLRQTTAEISGDDDLSKDALACIFALLTVDDWLAHEEAAFSVIVCTVTAARCAGVLQEEQAQRDDVAAVLKRNQAT